MLPDGSVHREKELAVVGDLDPARRGLAVGERRTPDGRQRPVPGHVEGRDRPEAGPVVGVGDEQLERVGRAELAAERPEPLSGEGRPRSGGQQPVPSDGETFDLRGASEVADQCGADRVEEHVVGLRAVGQGHRRAGQGLELPQGESVNPVKFGPTAPELATYTRSPCTAMLTGVGPPEETTPPGTSWRLPSQPTRRTEIWLLPASTASR